MQRTPSPRILTLPAHSRLFLLVLKPKHRRFFDSLHPIVSNTAAEPTAPVCWNKVKREQGRIEREGNKSEKGVRIPHFAVNTTQRHRRVFSSRAGQETQGGERPTTPTAPGRWLQVASSTVVLLLQFLTYTIMSAGYSFEAPSRCLPGRSECLHFSESVYLVCRRC